MRRARLRVLRYDIGEAVAIDLDVMCESAAVSSVIRAETHHCIQVFPCSKQSRVQLAELGRRSRSWGLASIEACVREACSRGGCRWLYVCRKHSEVGKSY